jgi:exopolyphosphatase/guanosine-5'-triphosphate,3'-diphosphate pyrophosphatase
MPRIGQQVEATGTVTPGKLAEVAGDVRRFAGVAREHGAHPLLFGATAAVRRARNRDEVLRALGEAAGVPCRLIAAEAEARLAFRGATGELRGEGLVLVADIGGGSTECVLGEAGRVKALASVPIGSGSATDRWLLDDPPTAEQRAACAAALRALLGGVPDGDPRSGLCTGGTASTLPTLLGRQPRAVLGSGDLDRCREVLDSAPSAEVAARLGIDPLRARVLAGGVEIVGAVMHRYRLDSISVSPAGLRHGMILAYLEKGERWIEG